MMSADCELNVGGRHVVNSCGKLYWTVMHIYTFYVFLSMLSISFSEQFQIHTNSKVKCSV